MERVNVEQELGRLKDFQRSTVEHAFAELFLKSDGSRRFLVADEVGLGKTLVARGLVAKALDHLWDQVDRLDVLYICSNADIARQNIKRLNLLSSHDDSTSFQRADRVTLLPITVQDLKQRKVNFISITPSTSIEVAGGQGTKKERALIYWLLQMAWPKRFDETCLIKFMAGAAGYEGFANLVQGFTTRHGYRIDRDLAQELMAVLRAEKELYQQIQQELPKYKQWGEHWLRGPEDRRAQNTIVGTLRALIAKSCIKALEPDLIIMDEFQRFSHLFDGDSESAELASELFSYSDSQNDVRVLLLSATPYKMYSITEERAQDDHYRDFLRTVNFLLNDPARGRDFESILADFRQQLFTMARGREGGLLELKSAMEATLRRVMSRTERIAETADNDGMLREIRNDCIQPGVNELIAYRDMEGIAKLLAQPGVMEYWKSSPYLLNFMDEYRFKHLFEAALQDPQQHTVLAQLLANSPALLNGDDYERFAPLDFDNHRLQTIVKDVIETDLWRLLWLPPSLPYYPLEGVFQQVARRSPTKRLIFSGWRIVPRAVSTLLSYEVERRIILEYDPEATNTHAQRERRNSQYPLRMRTVEGRPASMPVAALTYPCVYLANRFNPAVLGDGQVTLDELHAQVMQQLKPDIDRLTDAAEDTTQPDFNWYWLAPLLLDQEDNWAQEFLGVDDLVTWWTDSHQTQQSLQDHIESAQQLLAGEIALGTPPPDLLEQLAWMALAGPGVCAYRALAQNCQPPDPDHELEMRLRAARIGWAVRNLFNTPLFATLVRDSEEEQGYWRNLLRYSAEGCLQAVLDEYAHVLRESNGLTGRDFKDVVAGITEGICEALEFSSTTLKIDKIDVDATSATIELDELRPTVRFARPFSDSKDKQNGDASSMSRLRDAFNSPFWPYVLTSTSVGQEGLDFHWYCHAVVHWNLPLNPVDMEQREGRVHRYKGHAVRKNIAATHGQEILGDETLCQQGPQVWDSLFDIASSRKPNGHTDMVPYWLFPRPGGATIERHVPSVPMSRDRQKLMNMKRTLAAYRLVFGQPRQEDMMEYLLNHYDEEALAEIVERLRVDLRPAQDF